MESKQLLIGLALVIGAVAVFFMFVGQSTVKNSIIAPFQGSMFGSNASSTPRAPSPYQGSVSIEFVSVDGYGKGNGTYVRLYVENSVNEYINVTGWSLTSSSGKVQVPQARDFYTAEGVAGDIVLRGGGLLTLFAGESPYKENRREKESEWAAWLNSDFVPYPHGTMKLLDKENRVVDVYEY